jgi:hypothetical protein
VAWIESHTVLRNHRKIILLSRALRLNTAQTIGHLHLLWYAALEQQEDGDLSKWSDELIAELAGYTGDAPQFVRLLQELGWLDGKMIHDWMEYAGRYLETKYRTANPKKLKEINKNHRRTKVGLKSDFSRTPNLPNQQNQPYLTIEQFEELWKAYPRKLGKEKAFDKAVKQILCEKDFQDAKSAVENYAVSVKGKDAEYIKHGSTFFNKDWKDWINYKEVSNGTNQQGPKQRPGQVTSERIDGINWQKPE